MVMSSDGTNGPCSSPEPAAGQNDHDGQAVRLRYISRLPDAVWQHQHPRTLAILGSTGSIGRSALDVLRRSPDRFLVAALAGARNIPLLAAQATEFRPHHLALLDEKDIPELRRRLPSGYAPAIVAGQQGYETLAALPGVSTILSAQVGAAGLRATYAAVRAGKVVALANKEALVLAGALIRKACRISGASILPVDSEHNAIFQCLAGSFLNSDRRAFDDERRLFDSDPPDRPFQAQDGSQARGQVGRRAEMEDGDVTRLILTASGGPFFGWTPERLAKVTPEEALAHPNWTMGAKITIDSSTLMNKGLELIEAHHLYGLPLPAIEVLVHRESIIHSLVEYADGSQLAQLGQPDMRVPLANCLGWPWRLPTGAEPLDLARVSALTFARPDTQAFPCLDLARLAQERGCGSPVVLNAANEEAVAAFLERRIGYADIPALVRAALDWHADGGCDAFPPHREPEDIEAVLALDALARDQARAWANAHPLRQRSPSPAQGAGNAPD